MDLIFADDAAQTGTTRRGMGPLYGIGGLHVGSDRVRQLEKRLESLCSRTGFPEGEEFKWSPGRELWMAKNLVDVAKLECFVPVIKLLIGNDVKAIIVIEDTSRGRATTPDCSPLIDVSRLFLERADIELRRA